MEIKKKDQELLNLYIENRLKLKEVSNNIDFTSEDPLAQTVKSLLRKTFDYDNFNSSNFVNYLIKLCEYKYCQLYNLNNYDSNKKETLIYLSCLVTLDDFCSYMKVSELSLGDKEIEKLQNIFKEVSMIIYSLISYASGGNIQVIEEYISKEKGEEFSFVLNSVDSWVK